MWWSLKSLSKPIFLPEIMYTFQFLLSNLKSLFLRRSVDPCIRDTADALFKTQFPWHHHSPTESKSPGTRPGFSILNKHLFYQLMDIHRSVWVLLNYFHRPSRVTLLWNFNYNCPEWPGQGEKTTHSQINASRYGKWKQITVRSPGTLSQTEHPHGPLLSNPIICIWKKSSVHFSFLLEWCQ